MHANFAQSTIITAGLLATAATPALAAWPISDTESIQLGTAEALFFGQRQSIMTTHDAVWVAWHDSVCVGEIRLQRIATDGTLAAPGGIDFQADPTCAASSPPLLAAIGSGVAATRRNSPLIDTPVIAYDDEVLPVWQPGFSTNDTRYITNLTGMPNGDLLATSASFSDIHFDRLAPDGSPLWDTPTTLSVPSGANFVVRAVVPDSADGAYVVLDSPLAYLRAVYVQRIDPTGKALWSEPVRPVPPPPLGGISRHTPPTAIPDGQGGLYYIWTKGFETGTTPAPLMIQQIAPDGSLTYPIEGHRVSTDQRRQFDPVVLRHEDSGNVDIVWRNGQQEDQQIFAQRLAPDGTRLWTETGIAVTDIPPLDKFDASLMDGALVVTTSTQDGVISNQITDDGVVGEDWIVSSLLAANVRTIGVEGGVVVTWQADGPGLDDTLEAARLNRMGRLGDPACNQADLGAPFGVLDLSDIAAFIPAFLAGDPLADIAAPTGVLDLADVQAFVTAFTAGCP